MVDWWDGLLVLEANIGSSRLLDYVGLDLDIIHHKSTCLDHCNGIFLYSLLPIIRS